MVGVEVFTISFASAIQEGGTLGLFATWHSENCIGHKGQVRIPGLVFLVPVASQSIIHKVCKLSNFSMIERMLTSTHALL